MFNEKLANAVLEQYREHRYVALIADDEVGILIFDLEYDGITSVIVWQVDLVFGSQSMGVAAPGMATEMLAMTESEFEMNNKQNPGNILTTLIEAQIKVFDDGDNDPVAYDFVAEIVKLIEANK